MNPTGGIRFMERRQYALPHAETKGARRPLQGGGLAKHDAGSSNTPGSAWRVRVPSKLKTTRIAEVYAVLRSKFGMRFLSIDAY